MDDLDIDVVGDRVRCVVRLDRRRRRQGDLGLDRRRRRRQHDLGLDRREHDVVLLDRVDLKGRTVIRLHDVTHRGTLLLDQLFARKREGQQACDRACAHILDLCLVDLGLTLQDPFDMAHPTLRPLRSGIARRPVPQGSGWRREPA